MYKVQNYLDDGTELDDAVETAIRECVEEDIIADFLKKNGGQIMSLLRYVVPDEEKREMHLQQGREEGRKAERAKAQIEKETFIRSLIEEGVPIDKIAIASGMTRMEIETL